VVQTIIVSGPLSGGQISVSDHYQIAALGTFNQFRVPGYSRTNAQLTYNAPDNRWYLQGYVKNIENAIVISYAATTSFPSVQLSEPRTYGVRAGYKF